MLHDPFAKKVAEANATVMFTRPHTFEDKEFEM
jgi:hypothetical protein